MKKVGIIDVGGGMRDIYGAGIFDYLMDKKIEIPMCLGVSAGSANVASYVSKQKGRNISFYEEYSREKKYMSLGNLIKTGSYLNVDYVYGELSNEGGRNPWDFDAAMKSSQELVVIASDANTGKPVYFTKKDYSKNDYGMLKGSSNLPIVNKAFKWKGYELFDGVLTDPMPYEYAFSHGCTNVVLVLTRPVDFRKKTDHVRTYESLRKKYPKFVEKLYARCDLYNTKLDNFIEKYVSTGKGFVIGPEDTFGVDTLTKDKKAMQKLYKEGYEDGKKIEKYLSEIK